VLVGVKYGRGEWQRPTDEAVTFVGFCPLCAELARRRNALEERRVMRAKMRRRTRPDPRPEAVDWDRLKRGE
jgi:hypothetical protein